jgi:saxitoxin biosynthesis operon SxtJ-like protein
VRTKENGMSRTQDTRQLRQFGLLVGGIFGAMGLWPLVWRHQSPRLWAMALAVALVVPALVAPRVLAPAHRAWMALAEVLAWVNTRILLGLVFYLVVTPIGLLMRLLRRDPMRRQLEPAGESYRVRCTPRPATHMLRQF